MRRAQKGCPLRAAAQVTGASKEGDVVKLTVEPAKGGESQTIEASVVLVSAGMLLPSASRVCFACGILLVWPVVISTPCSA